MYDWDGDVAVAFFYVFSTIVAIVVALVLYNSPTNEFALAEFFIA